MENKILTSSIWLPHYLAKHIKETFCNTNITTHIYISICDHFEPYCNKADKHTARKRILTWVDKYPKIAERFIDSSGKHPRYTFFYPEEEYDFEDMKILGSMCDTGIGEVEIHLHHDNDTHENLKNLLLDYKKRLHEKHGLLSLDKITGEISYGFIHGNWALNNSRPDKKWCGIDDETSILLDTGCYADFTFPSAPSSTQTRKVNSIYYAKPNSNKSKAHNWGVNSQVGKINTGLLMIQGPLCLDWSNRKFNILPRIENGDLCARNMLNKERLYRWLNQNIVVRCAPSHKFIKIYTHGAQDRNIEMIFKNNILENFFKTFLELAEECKAKIFFTSAREMVNVIKSLESAIENKENYNLDTRYTR
jgi:hypothetical protein